MRVLLVPVFGDVGRFRRRVRAYDRRSACRARVGYGCGRRSWRRVIRRLGRGEMVVEQVLEWGDSYVPARQFDVRGVDARRHLDFMHRFGHVHMVRCDCECPTPRHMRAASQETLRWCNRRRRPTCLLAVPPLCAELEASPLTGRWHRLVGDRHRHPPALRLTGTTTVHGHAVRCHSTRWVHRFLRVWRSGEWDERRTLIITALVAVVG